MESKIIGAISYIRLTQKQRVTPKRIYNYISKDTDIIGEDEFKSKLQHMENEGKIFKTEKKRKISYFIGKKTNEWIITDNTTDKPTPTNTNVDLTCKNLSNSDDDDINALESFIDNALENIQKHQDPKTPVTTNIETPNPNNTPYKQSSVKSHSFCDISIFQEEIMFLRKELENKQNIIENLLKFLNNTNRTQVTGSDTLISVENLCNKQTRKEVITNNETINNDNDISVTNKNNVKDKERRKVNDTVAAEINSSNKKDMKGVDNVINCSQTSASSTNTDEDNKNEKAKEKMNNQLHDIRKRYHSNYNKSKTSEMQAEEVVQDESTGTTTDEKPEQPKPWKPNTTLIVGDSMVAGLNQQRMSVNQQVKVRSFPGATTHDMKDYLKPLLKKKPDNVILHIGTNNAVNEPSRNILNEILMLKTMVENTLPSAKVVVSNVITRTDNGKAALTVIKLNELLEALEIDVIDNRNIGSEFLNRGGLHLKEQGSGKLAVNFLKKIRSLRRK